MPPKCGADARGQGAANATVRVCFAVDSLTDCGLIGWDGAGKGGGGILVPGITGE